MKKLIVSRRTALKAVGAAGAALSTPYFFSRGAFAQSNDYCNAPKGDTVTLGFNVPQTGAYADEGADELRAYELAVEHINAGGGGMIDTFSSKVLRPLKGGSPGAGWAASAPLAGSSPGPFSCSPRI